MVALVDVVTSCVSPKVWGMTEEARAARTWAKIVRLALSARAFSCGVWGIVVGVDGDVLIGVVSAEGV